MWAVNWARNRFVWVHGPNSGNLAPRMAGSFDELEGTKEDVSWGVFPLMNQDVLYVATNGGGGYLDPFMRDPEAVLNDVRDRVVSRQAAKSIYGTILTEESVDLATTVELRRTMIARRKEARL